MEEAFKNSVQKIFNNWTGLKLAVEHGMGGRNGHKTAIDIMDYMYQYCIRNANVSQSELQDVLEDLMDQEFDTVCEDNSIPEICLHLVKFLNLCQTNKLDEVQLELNKLPNNPPWLRPDVQITYTRVEGDSSSSDDEDDDEDDGDDCMDVDDATPQTSRQSKHNVPEQPDVDPGWTLISKKKK